MENLQNSKEMIGSSEDANVVTTPQEQTRSSCCSEEEKEKEREKQKVWSWGAGTDGQLATDILEDHPLPQPIPSLSSLNISSIACGGAHALALLEDGNVVSWGRGNSGQLGHGDFEGCTHPRLITSLAKVPICNVSAGWSHSAMVSRAGELFTCGDGAFGQLGHGDYVSHCLPAKVKAFASKHVSLACCGMRHTLVLLKDTTVFAFGYAKHGQLGIASKENMTCPRSKEERVQSFNAPVRVMELDTLSVVCVFANGQQSAALTETGLIYIWGRGCLGALDIPFPVLLKSVRCCQLALAWKCGLALLEDGAVYMWGRSNLEKMDVKDMDKANLVPLDEIDAWLQFRRVSSFEGMKITQIAAGAEHFAVISGSEVLMTWGWGEHGQLGLGNNIDQPHPQIIPLQTSPTADKTKLAVYCGSGFTFAVRHLL